MKDYESQERMQFGGLNKALLRTKGIMASAGYVHLKKLYSALIVQCKAFKLWYYHT